MLVLRQLALDDQVRAVGLVSNRDLGRRLALGQLLPGDAQKVVPRLGNGNGLGAGLYLGQGQALVRHLQILRLGAGFLRPVLAVLEGVGAHQLRPGNLRLPGQLRQGHVLKHVPAHQRPAQHKRLGRPVGKVPLDRAVRLRRKVGRFARAPEGAVVPGEGQVQKVVGTVPVGTLPHSHQALPAYVAAAGGGQRTGRNAGIALLALEPRAHKHQPRPGQRLGLEEPRQTLGLLLAPRPGQHRDRRKRRLHVHPEHFFGDIAQPVLVETLRQGLAQAQETVFIPGGRVLTVALQIQLHRLGVVGANGQVAKVVLGATGEIAHGDGVGGHHLKGTPGKHGLRLLNRVHVDAVSIPLIGHINLAGGQRTQNIGFVLLGKGVLRAGMAVVAVVDVQTLPGDELRGKVVKDLTALLVLMVVCPGKAELVFPVVLLNGVVQPGLGGKVQVIHPVMPQLRFVAGDAVNVGGEDHVRIARGQHENIGIDRVLLVPEYDGHALLPQVLGQLIQLLAVPVHLMVPQAVLPLPGRLDKQEVGLEGVYLFPPVGGSQLQQMTLRRVALQSELVHDGSHLQVLHVPRAGGKKGFLLGLLRGNVVSVGGKPAQNGFPLLLPLAQKGLALISFHLSVSPVSISRSIRFSA